LPFSFHFPNKRGGGGFLLGPRFLGSGGGILFGHGTNKETFIRGRGVEKPEVEASEIDPESIPFCRGSHPTSGDLHLRLVTHLKNCSAFLNAKVLCKFKPPTTLSWTTMGRSTNDGFFMLAGIETQITHEISR